MTMPEEIYAEMDKAFALGKNHDDGLPVDDTQLGIEWVVDILKSTVDAQREADSKTIAALAGALETLYADFKIHAGYVYSERTEQTLSDNAPRIAEAQK